MGGLFGRSLSLTRSPIHSLGQRPGAFVGLRGFLGIGYKTLPYTEYLGRPIIADNMYLSLLVETGVFGLLALGTVWRVRTRGSRRQSK